MIEIQNTIVIPDINVKYISSKTDKFNDNNCYYEITDRNHKSKLKHMLAQLCPECKLPLWETDDGEYMIKVKSKYAPNVDIPTKDLVVQIVFKYYCMDVMDGLINQGFYAMMSLPMDD